MKKLNNPTENFVSKRINQRRVRCWVALLSALVLFLTVNTLKLEADTLERIATCGIEQHVHDESCYDASGALICGLAEHAHTDACFQQRPQRHDLTRVDGFMPLNAKVTLATPMPKLTSNSADGQDAVQAEADYYSDIPTEVGSGIEPPVDEIETELAGEDAAPAVEDAVPLEIVYEDQAEETVQQPEYVINGSTVLLSDILSVLGMKASGIQTVGELEGDTFAEDPVNFAVEATQNDYELRVLRDFDAAELGVMTDDEVIIITLKNGIAPVEDNDDENPSENDDINIEETHTGETDDEAAADETVDEETEDSADEATEETVDELTEDTDDEETEEAADEMTVDATEEETVETVEETETAAVVPDKLVALDFADYDCLADATVYFYAPDRGAVLVNAEELAEADGVHLTVNAPVVLSMEADLGLADLGLAELEAALEEAPEDIDVRIGENPVLFENGVLIISGDGELTVNGVTYSVTNVTLPSRSVESDNIIISTVDDQATLLGVTPAFEDNGEDEGDIYALFAAQMDENIVTATSEEIQVDAIEPAKGLLRSSAMMATTDAAPEAEEAVADAEETVADAEETVEETAETETAEAAVETRTLKVRVYDVSLIREGESVEPDAPIHVETTFDAPLEGENFQLYHIVDGKPEEVDGFVKTDDQGRAIGMSFDTASLSPFAVVYYTVEYEIVNSEVTVKVDFTDIVQNGVDFDQNDVITALNDGVGVSIAELEQGYTEGTDNVVYGELYVDYTTADNKDSLVQKSWGLMDVVSAGDGLTVENGEIRVTADGTVVLSDGESTINIKITGYQASVQKVLGDGATIEALGDTELPMGASASYEDLSEKADELAETYNLIPEQTEEEKKEIGFSAFDVAVTVPSDDYVAEGSFAVTVPHTLDVEVPENAKVTYELFHIHEVDGEIKAEPVENATFEDGKVSFVTDGFSEYVVRYTVDFEYTDPETGETYQFHMPGDGTLLVSQLFAALHIREDVAQIVDVAFTDDTLLRVEQVEADWLLTSLKPFDTTETLTITFADGHQLVLTVTDDQSEAQGNLADLIKTLTLSAGGNQVTYNVANDGTVTTSGNSNFSVKPRTNFDLQITFQERPGDAAKQFTSSEMVFNLPNGLSFEGYDQEDVTLSFDGEEIHGNRIWVENGQLHIDLDETDPNWKLVETSGSSYIDVDIHGQFGESSEEVKFTNDITVDVRIDTTTNAKISKSGNYDSNKKAMHYTITVESDGATSNISLTDTLRSSISGLQAIDGTVTVTSNKHDPYSGATVSVASDGQTLTGTIASMENGERVTIDYYAPIDMTKVPSNGTITANTMGNGVTMTANETPNGPDDNTAHVDQSNEIDFSSFYKNNDGVDQTIWEENGIKYKTVKWKITSNTEKLISLAGTKIKDKIAAGSQAIMDYSGTGITITVDKGGETETREIPWSSLNLNNDSWEYTIPSTDGAYSYVIEYTTKVKITGLLDGVTVKNDSEGPNGEGHAEASVGPKEEEKFTTHKKLISYDNDEAIWQIDINVPSDGYETLEVYDKMPRSGQLFDNLNTAYVQVDGLVANETYSSWQPVYAEEWVNNQQVNVLVGYKLVFSHDGGSNNGLKGTGSPRTVTVTLKTNINSDWVNATLTDSNKLWHQNEADVTANGTKKTVSDGFAVTPEGLKKENGGMRDIVMNDGTTRKLYKFNLIVSGVDRTTDDTIVIKDYFDTSILEYLDPTATSDSVNSWQAVVFGGTSYTQFDGSTQFGIVDVSNLNENGNKGVTLSIEKDDLAKMSNGHWFPTYKIEIYLVSKEAIANEALQHDGHLDMKNKAEWKTEDEVDFSYDYPGLNKQMTSFDSKTRTANFRLVINPDKATMNGGNNMTLIDAYLNDLSIDYETIRVVTDPAGMEVSYDATTTKPDSFDVSNLKSGINASNMSYLVFDIPDNTKISIFYQARLVGQGNLNIYNTALLNGHYSQTVDQWQQIWGSSSGGGSITKLRLMKYEKNHMENTLGGVTFGLWAASTYTHEGYTPSTTPEKLLEDGKYLKLFTTATAAEAAADSTKKTKTGMVELILDQSVDGTELIRGQKYILRELTTPTGYASDNTEYEFTIPENGQPDYTQYYYMNNDVLNVKNTPHGGLKIIKSVRNATLTDAQKERISFKVTKIKDANGVALDPVEPIKFKVGTEEVDTLTFDQFVNNNYLVSDSMEAGTYEVEEINTAIEGYDLIDASVRVDKNESQIATNLSSVKTQVVLTNDDITNGTVHAVSFVNNYESVKVTVFKNDEKGNRLVGAKFKMTKDGADFAEFEITEENKDSGYLFTGLTAGNYVLTETEAPEGYVPITEPVKFTVAENGEGKLELTYNTPEAERQGYVAFAQTSRTANYFTVKNEKVPPETEVVLQKKWVDLEGNEITDEYKQETLTVDLMRRVYADPVFINANVGLNSGSIKKDLVVTADSNVTVQLRYPYGVQGGVIKSNPALTFTDADGNELTVTPTEVYNHDEENTDITYIYDLGAVSKDITIGGTTSANASDVVLTIDHTSTPMREEVALAGQTVTWDDSTDVADHWSRLFENLPLTYSEKGSDGMRHTYGYEYYIVEKNGVIPVEEVNNDGTLGGTITIKNKKSKTEIEVEKIWKDEDGNVITGTIDKDSVQMEIYQVEHRTPDERDEYYTVEVQFGENGMDQIYAKKVVAKGTNVKVTYQTTNDPSGLYARAWFPTTVSGAGFNNVYTDILGDVTYRMEGQYYICEYTLINVTDDTNLGFTIGSNVPADYQYYKVDWPEAGKATEGTKYGDTITVLKSEDWKKKVGDLPLYAEKPDGSIVYYTYYVQEVPVEGYGMSYEPMIDLTTRSREVVSGKIEVTNQQFYKETKISVEKKWKDQAGQDITDSSKLPDTVDIELYQVEWDEGAEKPRYYNVGVYYDADQIATTLRESLVVEKDGYVDFTVRSNYSNLACKVWNGAGNYGWYDPQLGNDYVQPTMEQAGPDANGIYTYTMRLKIVRSLNIGFATGQSTNLDKTTVTATPEGESSMRSDGVLYNTYTLEKSASWEKIIDQLPQKAVVDGRRVAYTYYVIEKTKVPRFEVTYSPASDVEGQSKDVDTGTVSLTNTEVDEYVLEVNKTWFRKDNTPITDKDGSIEFDVLQAEVTPSAKYDVSMTYGQNGFTGLGSYSKEGIDKGSKVTVVFHKRVENSNAIPTECAIGSWTLSYYNPDTEYSYSAHSISLSDLEWTKVNGDHEVIDHGNWQEHKYWADFTASIDVDVNSNMVIQGNVAENDTVNNYFTVNWPQAQAAEAIDWENASLYHTYTLSSADDWMKIIGLPKTGVNASGDDVEYRYLVREHAVDGYESTINGNTGDGIVFSQDSANVGIKNTKLPSGNLKIKKNFLPTTVAPDDASKLVFKVYGPYDNAAPVPALADLASVEPKVTVGYDEFTSGEYTIEDLGLGTYLVVESGHDATGADVLITDYHFVADGSTTTATANLTTDGQTVLVELTNKYEEDKGAIVITKKVRFNGIAADTDEKKAAVNKTFKFEVKKDGVAIAGSPFEITVTDGSSNKVVIPNLLEGDYTIEEIERSGLVLEKVTGGKSVDATTKVITVHVTKRNNTEATVTSDGKASFTNDLPTTTVVVNKTWLKEGVNYSGRLAEMFGDVTVYFDIVKVAKGATGTDIATAETAKDVFGENAVGSMTGDTWTATVYDLPVLGDNEKYVVRETSVKDGKGRDITAKFNKTLTDDTTINNAPETTDVTVSKAWKPEIPENTTARLTLYKGKTADTAAAEVTSITLDGTADDAAEYINGTDHSAGKKQETTGWSAKFSELPKYGYDETDGVYEIVYVIKEDTLPAGYSVTYAGDKTYAISGDTVTNKKNPGDLELTKKVAGDGADVNKAFAFTIKLTAPAGETLAETYAFKKGEADATGITYTRTDENTKATVTGIQLKKDEVFTIVDLPAGTVYEITETDYSSEGYSGSANEEKDPMRGTITGGTKAKEAVEVTNTFSAGNLTVEKILEGNAIDTTKNFDFSVTFRKADLNGAKGSYKLGKPDELEQAASTDISFTSGVATITFTLKGGEKAQFDNLPVGTTFTVSETSADADGYETTVATTGGTLAENKSVTGAISANTKVTASYTNKKNTTTVEATKAWKSGGQALEVWPEDVKKVEFKLFASVDGATAVAIDHSSVSGYFTGFDAAKDIDADTVNAKASWSNLPTRVLVPAVEADPAKEVEAVAAHWVDVAYSVVETSITYTDGKTEEVNKLAADGVVTNEANTEISGTKAWADVPSPLPEGSTATIGLYTVADETYTVYPVDNQLTVTLDGTKVEDPAETSAYGYKEDEWKATFRNLPKYDAEGKVITYAVRETQFTYKDTTYTVKDGTTVTPDGWFTVTQEGNDITNTEKTQFEFTKAWFMNFEAAAENWPTDEHNNYLPITVELTRRLKYGNDNTLPEEKDSETLVLENLTPNTVFPITGTYNGSAYTVTKTELVEGKTDAVKFTITGLPARGSMTIEETQTEGAWVYEIEETNVNPEYKVSYIAPQDGIAKQNGTTIRNEKMGSYELPSTGGPGTTGLYILGSILTMLAAVLLITKKRSDAAGID